MDGIHDRTFLRAKRKRGDKLYEKSKMLTGAQGSTQESANGQQP